MLEIRALLQVNISDSEAEEDEGLDAAAQCLHTRPTCGIMPLVSVGMRLPDVVSLHL